MCLLRCFFLVSGLKINVHKSNIFGVGVFEVVVNEMVALLGCIVSPLTFSYLSVPVGSNMGLCENWKGVVDKFIYKLSNWKARTLSVGSRLSLIKAVLGNLPPIVYVSL